MEKGKHLQNVLFILMNIFGPPAMQIVCFLLWDIIGIGISTALFFILFYLWKKVSKSKGRLSFSPSFSFGNKTYRYGK